MAYYIKVTQAVADKLGLTALRNRTKDGGVILWQSDVNKFNGDTLLDRVKVVGGVALTAVDAKREIDGNASVYATPVTPVEFGDTGADAVESNEEGES